MRRSSQTRLLDSDGGGSTRELRRIEPRELPHRAVTTLSLRAARGRARIARRGGLSREKLGSFQNLEETKSTLKGKSRVEALSRGKTMGVGTAKKRDQKRVGGGCLEMAGCKEMANRRKRMGGTKISLEALTKEKEEKERLVQAKG